MSIQDIVDKVLQDTSVYVISRFWKGNLQVHHKNLGIYFNFETALLSVCRHLLKDLNSMNKKFIIDYYDTAKRRHQYDGSPLDEHEDRWCEQSCADDYKIEHWLPGTTLKEKQWLNFDHRFKARIVSCRYQSHDIEHFLDAIKSSVDVGRVPRELFDMLGTNDISWMPTDYLIKHIPYL